MSNIDWTGSNITGPYSSTQSWPTPETETEADVKNYFYQQQRSQDQTLFVAARGNQANKWTYKKDLPVREEPALDGRKYPAVDITDDLGRPTANNPATFEKRPDAGGDFLWTYPSTSK